MPYPVLGVHLQYISFRWNLILRNVLLLNSHSVKSPLPALATWKNIGLRSQTQLLGANTLRIAPQTQTSMTTKGKKRKGMRNSLS